MSPQAATEIVTSLALAAPVPTIPGLRGLTPPQQLSRLLAHFRHYNLAFDTAWNQAMEHIVWPSSRRDASEWRTSMNDTREGWRACYLRWAQLPSERAVAQLWSILSSAVV